HPADAEHCFRRACAIATAALKPDHPFVATSRQNLRDFCEARGKRIDDESPSHAKSQPAQPLLTRRFIRPLAIGGLGPALMLIVILIVIRPWLNSNAQVQSPSAIVTDAPQETPARPPAPLSVKPLTSSAETMTIIKGG